MKKLLPGFSQTSRSHPPSGMTTALASFPCSDSRVDVGDGTSEQWTLAQQWIELWAEIMQRWLENAPSGRYPAGRPRTGHGALFDS
jgi:hypothetical protein